MDGTLPEDAVLNNRAIGSSETGVEAMYQAGLSEAGGEVSLHTEAINFSATFLLGLTEVITSWETGLEAIYKAIDSSEAGGDALLHSEAITFSATFLLSLTEASANKTRRYWSLCTYYLHFDNLRWLKMIDSKQEVSRKVSKLSRDKYASVWQIFYVKILN